MKNEVLHSNPNHPGVEVSPVKSKDEKYLISFQAKCFESAIGYGQTTTFQLFFPVILGLIGWIKNGIRINYSNFAQLKPL